MTGYTKVDNWLFDEVMPNAKPNTFKVVMAIARCTNGWKKECDQISMSRFQELTGIASRATLNKAIQDALESGYISRSEIGISFEYRLMASTETVPVSDDQYRNSTDTGTETVLETGTETVHTKENRKESIKDLSDDFTSIAGVFPSAGFYEMDWEEPLGIIYDRAGDYEAAKDLIERAVEFARNGTKKRYTITSPKSIINIVANLEVNDKKLSVGAV